MTLNIVFLFCKDNQLAWMVRATLVRGFFSSGILHCVTGSEPFHSISNQLHRDSVSYPRKTEYSATPPWKPQHSQPYVASLMLLRFMSSSFNHIGLQQPVFKIYLGY